MAVNTDGIYLCLDVGGTEIKAAPVDRSGNILQTIRHFPSRAKEPADVLLAHFSGIFEAIRLKERAVSGLRIAFPGPFDYQKGVCLLQGLDKYDALYQVDLRRAFSQRTRIAPEEILFSNDASAFALGEMAFGQARDACRTLFVCIGTGCGSAFGTNGRLAPDGIRSGMEVQLIGQRGYRWCSLIIVIKTSFKCQKGQAAVAACPFR